MGFRLFYWLFLPTVVPLGPKEREVRRIPWIFVSIVAANILVFSLVSFSPWATEASRMADTRTKEFVQYWTEHPNLRTPPEYERYFGHARVERERKRAEKVRAYLESRGVHLPVAEASPVEQRELDARAKAMVDAVQSTPGWKLGYVPARPTPQSVLSSVFMHAGWGHLIGNMLMLLLVGPFLEDRWGRPLFTAFYVVAGIVAAMT